MPESEITTRHLHHPDHHGGSLQIAVPSLPNPDNTIVTGGGVGGVDLAAIAIANAVEAVHK